MWRVWSWYEMNVGRAITLAMQEQKAEDEWSLTQWKLVYAIERMVHLTTKIMIRDRETG